MLNKERKYLFLIFIHIALGAGIYVAPFLSKIYGLLILLFGAQLIIRKADKNHEALFAAAYLMSAEVFLRMTDGVFLYEFGKYGVMFFMLLGMYYSGFSKSSLPYWIFLLLLVPGILIATQDLSLTTDIRKRIIFNISGPVCLGIASVYALNRRLSIRQLNDLLLAIGLPIVSCAVYLTIYVPELKTVLGSTESNFTTSGGFGPNQVSTILGLGMFVFFARMVMASGNRLNMVINLVFTLVIGYRGLVTFSRGGAITGIAMIVLLAFFLYINTGRVGKAKLGLLLGLSFVLISGVWLYAESQTGGLIGKRYANQDARGRTKSSDFSGREKVAETEINAFFENPVFGIGVAKAKEVRLEDEGLEVNSHSEITRMVAEHGSLGIMGLLILLGTPTLLYFDNKQHIYLFCFLAFWLMTINHAAMRIAAPGFVYALSLLKVSFAETER